MDTVLIHRAISHDGTQITGHVSGKGPPLVFVHGALDDGELDWGAVPRLLTDRFACYVMSTRNRGLSGENRDVSRQRLVEDVTAFADSVGEPVGLVGTSGGGMLALGAAAHAAAVSAVAAYEPVVLDVVDRETLAGLQATLEAMRQAAAEGRSADAARMFSDPQRRRDGRPVRIELLRCRGTVRPCRCRGDPASHRVAGIRHHRPVGTPTHHRARAAHVRVEDRHALVR